MSDTAVNAWRHAERVCFEKILRTLQAEKGVTAYSPDDGLPRTFDNENKVEMWTFEISGGADPFRGEQPSSGCYMMDAMFRGIFLTRERAQRVCGLLWDVFPWRAEQDKATDGDAYVQLLTSSANPTLTRQTVEVSEDLSAGGEIRVWAVEYPLTVAFNNADDNE